MAILYSKVQRINPQDREAAKKWYIVPNRVEQKSEKEIATALTKNTTLSSGEALMAINELQSVILSFLLDGYTVQMGDWGSFHVTVNCDGAETEEACTTDLIKSVNIRFRPGASMKESLAKATFTAR
ncbi:MAG: HU family DNA-binding protein [Mangrovibacterium sp.]